MAELVSLCAVDYRLFCRTFFPRTFRDDFPEYSDRIWLPMEAHGVRFLNLQIFRGGAKTTNCRGYTARRIAYGISRTVLIITAAADKAEKTVRWLKRAVERNRLYASTFQLRPGKKWAENELEIIHGLYDCTVAVVGFGIHGSVRGINIDDYRPDLILFDDVVDEENSATLIQRDKIENLALGAVKNTLAPESESPDAKMIILQTPLNAEDVSMKAAKDPSYVTVRQPCWTLETENFPLEFRKSAWEKRFPTRDLIKDKIGHIARNKESVFAREWEVKIITTETAAFRREWLRFYDYESLPSLNKLYVILSIDPVPPPTPIAVAKGLHQRDFEVISAIAYYRGDYYLLALEANRGHDPSWTIRTVFELASRWKAKEIVVETHAYQATLAWLLEQAMRTKKHYIPIFQDQDRRAKVDKITDAFKLVCPFGNFYVHSSMSNFISNFCDYPAVPHDDDLDSVAQGIKRLSAIDVAESDSGEDDSVIDDTSYGRLQLERRAP